MSERMEYGTRVLRVEEWWNMVRVATTLVHRDGSAQHGDLAWSPAHRPLGWIQLVVSTISLVLASPVDLVTCGWSSRCEWVRDSMDRSPGLCAVV